MTITILFCSFLVSFTSGDRPFAHTEYGDVLGTEWRSFKGRKFQVFMSIPFAEKPIGKLRFEDPVAPKPWFDPIDGSAMTPTCIQNAKADVVTGQEDCLYINVFTPNLNLRNTTDPLPVILFIHGGAFYFFSSLTFGPRYLLDKDIVLVTFNYRLGIFGIHNYKSSLRMELTGKPHSMEDDKDASLLSIILLKQSLWQQWLGCRPHVHNTTGTVTVTAMGFLSTEDTVIPGNAGMKDQVMALGWVQRNIHNFGGDPGSVTLMGMSAGSVSLHMHYFSKLSRGLFHRGYMLGGTSFNPWAFQKKPLEKARRSAKWVGCPYKGSSRKMVDCLKTAPAPILARSVSLFQNEYGPLCPWGPVVDRWSRTPFLDEYPLQALLGRRHYSVPLIISDASSPGLFPTAAFMANDLLLAELDLHWEALAPSLLDTEDTLPPRMSEDVMAGIREHYLGRGPVYRNITNLIKMMSDRLYFADLGKAVSLHAAVNPRIHLYVFNYKGKRSTANDFLGEKHKFGAAHIDDLYYLMNRTSPEPTEFNKTDVKMIERLSEMVYRFAKTGSAVLIPGVRWPPQRGPSSALFYLRLDSPDEAVPCREEDFGEASYWDSLPLQEPWAGRYSGGNYR